MARHFTLAEAQFLLPEVERAVQEAIALKAAYSQAETEFQHHTHRITLLGGSLVDPRQLLLARNRRDATAARLQKAIESIQVFGCVVKDLDIGLVDFPTLYRGQEVYLCWKLGERGIRFWHGVDEGFRGRKPVDQDFLDHHRGDRAQ